MQRMSYILLLFINYVVYSIWHCERLKFVKKVNPLSFFFLFCSSRCGNLTYTHIDLIPHITNENLNDDNFLWGYCPCTHCTAPHGAHTGDDKAWGKKINCIRQTSISTVDSSKCLGNTILSDLTIKYLGNYTQLLSDHSELY